MFIGEEPIHIKVENKSDIAQIVLMPGDPLRAKYIAEEFLEDAKLVTSVRNMLGYTGLYKGKRVTIMGSGMGMPSMSIYAFELIHYFNVKKIIRIGTCGAVSPKALVGEVLLSDRVYSESNFAYTYNDYQEHVVKASKSLNEIIKSTAGELNMSDKIHEGMLTTMDVFGPYIDYDRVLNRIPKEYERNLTTRVKLISNMNITETRLPQDGAIKGRIDGTDLDMRVSVLPTNEGEKVVIRILDYTRSLAGLEALNFSHKNFKKISKMLTVPNGIILVTGATGSGKSTTTYSMLQSLNKEETNIITVEDPIEMNLEGINQVQVNSDIGMTFAAALRSILRQDPNVLLPQAS